MTCNFI